MTAKKIKNNKKKEEEKKKKKKSKWQKNMLSIQTSYEQKHKMEKTTKGKNLILFSIVFELNIYF